MVLADCCHASLSCTHALAFNNLWNNSWSDHSFISPTSLCSTTGTLFQWTHKAKCWYSLIAYNRSCTKLLYIVICGILNKHFKGPCGHLIVLDKQSSMNLSLHLFQIFEIRQHMLRTPSVCCCTLGSYLGKLWFCGPKHQTWYSGSLWCTQKGYHLSGTLGIVQLKLPPDLQIYESTINFIEKSQ